MPTQSHTKLGENLLNDLITLRDTKGSVALEDVSRLLEGVAATLDKDTQHIDLGKEIERLAQDIIALKGEIFSITNDELTPGAAANFTVANTELTEVVKMTEEATNSIMDAVDGIQNAASTVNDAKLSDKITEHTMKIYDACNFQDITGQRISKVMKLLEYMEARLTNLVLITGGALPDGYTPVSMDKVIRPDEDLMNGPQTTDEAPSQDDIDALFDSL